MRWNIDKVVIFAAIAMIIVIWIAAPFVLQYIFSSSEERGLFGDSYGVLNSLFSGLAFAGVIIAIVLQKNELKLQREELELTRVELTRAAQAQEASGNYIGEQSEVMKVTAELNGLAALIQARTEQINYLKNEQGNRSEDYISKIAKLDNERAENIHELDLLMHAVMSASVHDLRQ